MAGDIDQRATDWAARVDRGPLSADETSTLEAWLNADARHLGAYTRARAMLVALDRAQALGPSFDAAAFQPQVGLSRRAALRTGGAVAAATALLAIGVGTYDRFGKPMLVTALGEIRRVPLPDGSAVTLNTASRLAIAFTDHVRRVQLLDGEALFDVAKDALRPFVVEAWGTEVTAIGTSFTVHKLPSQSVEVLVREGVVEVGAGAAPLRVEASMVAYTDPGQHLQARPIEAAALSRKLVWRDGMIAFNGESLADAAAQFARYSALRLVIDDPAVAARKVTGLFSATDPAGFAKAVASSLELKAERRGNKVWLRATS